MSGDSSDTARYYNEQKRKRRSKRVVVKTKAPSKGPSSLPARSDSGDSAKRKGDIDLEIRRAYKPPKRKMTLKEFRELPQVKGKGGTFFSNPLDSMAGKIISSPFEAMLALEQAKQGRIKGAKRTLKRNKVARDWLLGPNVSKAITDEDYNFHLLYEAPLAGLPFARGPFATGRAAVAGTKGLVKGGAKAGAKAAAKEYKGPGLLNRAFIGKALQKAQGRKVWSEHLGQWVETAEPVARSRTGRAVERGVERARKKVHRTPLSGPLSSMKLSTRGDEKIGEELARSIRQTSTKLKDAPARTIVKEGKKLSMDQQYALRIVAEGGGPEVWARYAEKMGAEAAGRGDKAQAVAQKLHAGRYRNAAKYVIQGADGKWSLLPDAPERLHKVVGLFGKTQELRENIYQELGLLDPGQMAARIQMPGRQAMGAEFIEANQVRFKELEASPKRQELEQALHSLENLDEESVAAMMRITDQHALAYVDNLVEEAKKKIDFLTLKQEVETLTDDELLELMFARNAIKAAEVAPDLYYERLGSFKAQFPDELKQALEGQQGGSGVHFRKPENVPHISDASYQVADELISSGVRLPPGLESRESLSQSIANVFELAERGADGRDWYDRAAKVAVDISEATGVEPDKVAQLLAIYSQAADTIANVSFVKKAIDQYQAFGKIYAGRFPERQSKEAERVLQGLSWEGRKRSAFYANIVESINPEEFASQGSKPVTVDRWVVRMFDDTLGDVPGEYYDAFEGALQRMAQSLGWEPKEVQAAAWVSAKTDDLEEAARRTGRHVAGGGDAFEYGFDKNFRQLSLDLVDRVQTHPDALRAANAARKPDGGFTLHSDLTDASTKTGYGAAYGAYELRVPADRLAGKHIEDFRNTHRRIFKSQKTSRVGGWHNPKDGLVYLDVAKHFKTKAAAMAFARREGQVAIWDSAAGKSIPTGLEEDAANAIKRKLRGGSKQPPIPESIAKVAVPARPEAVIQYEDTLDRFVIDQGWNKTGKKITDKQRGWAEDLLFDQAAKAPDSPSAQEFHRLALANFEAVRQLQDEATDAAFGTSFKKAQEDLIGLPTKVKVGGEELTVGHNSEARATAEKYMARAGLPYDPPRSYAEVDPERAGRIAQAYDEMLDISDPAATPEYKREVELAYQAMAEETIAQYHEIARAGYQFEFMPRGQDPYSESPRLAMFDLRDNQHLYVFPTDEGFGSNAAFDASSNPLLADTKLTWMQDGELKPVTVNDLFRAVHDFFGHFKEGVGFRAAGEENAWRSHSAMYSPDARRAMTSETRGQNSWVNYGPHGEKNRTARTEDTVFADQKVGLLPEWVVDDGAGDAPKALPGSPSQASAAKSHRTYGVHYVPRAHPDEGPRELLEGLHPGEESVSHIALSPSGENAPFAVGLHELAHHLDFAIRSDPTLSKYGDEVANLGKNKDGEFDVEVFTNAMENFLLSESTKFPPKLRTFVRERMLEDYAKTKELYGKEGLGKAPGGLPPELEAIFELFLTHREAKSGKLMGFEDFDEGSLYLAEKPGLPTSWKQPLMKARAYQHNLKVWTSGNRKAAITFSGKDPTTSHEFRGFLKKMGFYKGPVTDAVGESGVKAARLGVLAEVKKAFVKIATDVPQNADDIPIRLDVTQKSTPELKRVLTLLEDMEFGRRKVYYKELDGVNLKEIEELRDLHFPGELDGETSEEVARGLINSAAEEPIDNIKWISREALEASGYMASPQALRMQQAGWTAEVAGRGFDVANGLIKASLLQLNPAYYTMNFLGNEAMALMQQGIFFAPNLLKASKLSRELGEEASGLIDHLMGAGSLSIGEIKYAGDPMRGVNILNDMATKLVDRIPRRSAWLHESRRMGITDSEQIKELLRLAQAGDEEALKVTDFISRRANDALVDYERLNPFERKFVTRIMFFYPWIKGATRWTARFPLEHPVQAMAFAALYAAQQQAAGDRLGDRPWYQHLATPLGFDVERGGEQFPMIMNPKQLLPWSTPLELEKSIIEGTILGATNRQPFSESFTPVLESGLTALGGRRSFDDQEVPQTAGTFLDELLSFPPIVKKIGSLAEDTEDTNRLYPRSLQDKVVSIGLGSLAPTPYNPEKGKWMAKGERGPAPEHEAKTKVQEYKAAFGQAPPKEIVDAYDSKAQWKQALSVAHQAKPDLSDEELTSLKLSLLVRLKPNFKNVQKQALAGIAAGEGSQIDSWIERELGWNDLASITEAINKRTKERDATAVIGG